MRDASDRPATHGDAGERGAGTPDPGNTPTTLADKLNKLFSEIRQGNGKSYSNNDVAEAIARNHPNIQVSSGYLSALRTGARRNPNLQKLRAIAEFFGVQPAYFFDEETARRTEAEIALAKVIANERVTQLALRALHLTPQGLTAIAEIVERVIQSSEPETRPPAAQERDD